MNIAPELSSKAKQALVLPHLKSSSLISLGQLCDDNCNISLDKKDMLVYKDKKLIMRGYRNKSDGLWDIPIKSTIHLDNVVHPKPKGNIYKTNTKQYPIPPFLSTLSASILSNITKLPKKRNNNINSFLSALNPIIDDNHFDNIISETTKNEYKANVILRKRQPKVTLAKYLHATCLSPVQSTFIKAIKNNQFISWPGLTPDLIQRNLPKVIATIQGHQKSERKGLQSTKNIIQEEEHITEEDDYFPTPPTPNIRQNHVCYTIIEPDTTPTAFIDLTGKFPKRSSRGHQYIMVGYHYDGNCILGPP